MYNTSFIIFISNTNTHSYSDTPSHIHTDAYPIKISLIDIILQSIMHPSTHSICYKVRHTQRHIHIHIVTYPVLNALTHTVLNTHSYTAGHTDSDRNPHRQRVHCS